MTTTSRAASATRRHLPQALQLALAQPVAGTQPEQRGRDRGQRAEQAFGLVADSAGGIELVGEAPEQRRVHAAGQIAGLRQRPTPGQQRPVAQQQRRADDPLGARPGMNGQQPHRGEAQADALQHAERPERARVHQPVRHRVQQQPQHDDAQRTHPDARRSAAASAPASTRTPTLKAIDTPTMNRKNGNTRSASVQPCHAACWSGAYT